METGSRRISKIQRWRAALLTTVLLPPLLAGAQQAPAGPEVFIRLKTAVSTRTSKPGDAVVAVVIAPVAANRGTVIAAGAVVRGTVEKVARPSAPGERAALLLRFNELQTGSVRWAILGRVESVDNARETVDEQGQIDGILAAETVGGRLDAGLSKLGGEYSGFADVLSAAKNAMFQQASTAISYPPGVEMTLRLAAPPPGQATAAVSGPRPMPDRAALTERVEQEPFQTIAQQPPKPSDVTNLLLIGTERALRRAFKEAGWSLAAGLNPRSKLETLRALAEDRGYREAPVSVLLLDGKPPNLVFEKANNTFARRHHLRIWRRPGNFRGKPVWAVAATHDIGIDSSDAERVFIHRIDSDIDRERQKVADDLLFTGRVQTLDLVTRPAVPRQGRNAVGDAVVTDGRIAVLTVH